MLKIVRVSRIQMSDLMQRLPLETRWIMGEFPAVNLFIPGFSTLIVCADEVEVRDFPPIDILSVASAVQCGRDMAEVK